MQTQWLIGFAGSDHLPWYLRPFVRRGFTHCFAMRFDHDSGLWLYVEWSRRGVLYEVLSSRGVQSFFQLAAQTGGDVVRIDVDHSRDCVPWVCWPWVYCVTAVQRITGIPGIFLRPHSFYCALLARGGVSMVSGSDGDSDGRNNEIPEDGSGTGAGPGARANEARARGPGSG